MKEAEPPLIPPSQHADASSADGTPTQIDATAVFYELKNGLQVAGVGEGVAAIMRETVFGDGTKRWAQTMERLRSVIEDDS